MWRCSCHSGQVSLLQRLDTADNLSISWAQIVRLSLPCPVWLPIVNVFFPLAAAIGFPVVQRLRTASRNKLIATALPYLIQASAYIPFIFLVLSTVYSVPTELLNCSAESQWQRMFQRKDDRAIRTIQNNLRCCGFNSLHDRAWPFPSRDVTSAACVQSQGYTNRCADSWEQHESIAAGLTVLASLLNWLLMVCVVRSTL